VIEIFATLMETAIFAYLGLFLFSSRYHWNKYLTIISIFATVMGRVIMIPMFSHVSNIINRMVVSRNSRPSCIPRNETNENVHVDKRMQIVLIFAGLRGAMSFALVEHIPLFDTITGQGTRLKPELKAMTSASIIFTVFVLGGATSYLMERIGYSINPKQELDALEVTPLVRESKPMTPNAADSRRVEITSRHRSTSGNSVRQRGGGTR
jgi:NhaP-type Na+/H+ or K+/H+ antiporter